MRVSLTKTILLAAALVLGASQTALARKPTVQECREAGEFIRNAALSRDNGMKRDAFIDRLQGDLMAIRGHPPSMRWFAQDEEDEAFLISIAESVFDQPKKSTEHETDMLHKCLARVDSSFKLLRN
jgi:hypothetical protein